MKTKEEQLNQLKETLKRKENETEPEKDCKKTVSVFDRDALMDKEQRLAERTLKNCEQEEVIARRASKPADKTRELNAREEDLTDATEKLLKRSEGLLEARERKS